MAGAFNLLLVRRALGNHRETNLLLLLHNQRAGHADKLLKRGPGSRASDYACLEQARGYCWQGSGCLDFRQRCLF